MTKFLFYQLSYIALVFTVYSNFCYADEFSLDAVKIFGKQDEAYLEPGSVYLINNKELELKQSLNPHEVLKEVPGVIIQEEDGLGLRPNIGLRGAHPHRSRKVTLMEDGVLISPAPYSAPAAYYFPLFSKVTGVEVYKGPSSIKYGPNSVGGAINFVTRDYIKSDSKKSQNATVNLSFGSFNTLKLQSYASGNLGKFDWLVEASRWSSDGFKELPQRGDTSFYRNDVMAKARYSFDALSEKVLSFKLGFSDERSNETYLGLSSLDFKSKPFSRYEASRLDRLDWRHIQMRTDYVHSWSDSSFSELIVYNHNFKRNWNKLNGFTDDTVDIRDVLNAPLQGQNPDFLEVLKGERDSRLSESLRFGINNRTYFSRGIKLNHNYSFLNSHNLDVGFLYHEDQIKRDHLLQDAQMRESGGLDKAEAFIDESNTNTDKARTYRVYALMDSKISNFILKGGARLEKVFLNRLNRITDRSVSREDVIVVPGLGLTYKINQENMSFIGVNKGITLPSPGQDESTAPEESINYEMGYRLRKENLNLDLVAFYNGYSNILGTCTFSSGCTAQDLDVQFNGGEATVYGLEFLLASKFNVKEFSMPISISATYTSAEFSNSFESNNREWGVGRVESGDPLPYVPNLSAVLSLGFNYKKFENQFIYSYRSKVFDQSVDDNRLTVNAFGTLNLMSRYNYNKAFSGYLKIDNVFDQVYVSSLRPFGFRPGAPRWVTFGLEYSF